MKFEVDREVFAHALARVRGAVSRTDNMPILKNVLLKVQGADKIEVMATDLKISMRLSMEASVSDPGEGMITIPAKEALGIVRGLAERRISVELGNDHKVHMTAGKSRRAVPSIPGEDFPTVTSPSDVRFSQIDRPALVRAFGSTLYAAPQADEAWATATVFVYAGAPGFFRFAAADGHRGGFLDLPTSALPGLTVGDGIAVPVAAVAEILRLFEPDGSAWMALEEGRLWAKTEEAVLAVQLDVAERPDFECVIPENRPFGMNVADVEELGRVLKSMGVLASGKNQSIALSMASGTMGLSLIGQALGEAQDELSVEYDGESSILYCNMRYFAEAFAVLASGPGRMEWVDGFHPIIILRPGDQTMFHFVMPLVV